MEMGRCSVLNPWHVMTLFMVMMFVRRSITLTKSTVGATSGGMCTCNTCLKALGFIIMKDF